MANRSSIKANEEELKAYFADLAAQNLWPLWTLNQSREPKSKATPYIWHWRDLRPLAMRAAELVGTKEAERRVLVLSNPGTQWVPPTRSSPTFRWCCQVKSSGPIVIPMARFASLSKARSVIPSSMASAILWCLAIL